MSHLPTPALPEDTQYLRYPWRYPPGQCVQVPSGTVWRAVPGGAGLREGLVYFRSDDVSR